MLLTTSQPVCCLCRRMEQAKANDERNSLEDVMYISVLEKFVELGVDMMPHIQQGQAEASQAMFQALTEGIHSKEALDMVKDHVRSIMGPAAMAFANTMLQISKLQAAQVCLPLLHHPAIWSLHTLCPACILNIRVPLPAESPGRWHSCFVPSCLPLAFLRAAHDTCVASVDASSMSSAGVRRLHHVWLLCATCGQAFPARAQPGAVGRAAGGCCCSS